MAVVAKSIIIVCMILFLQVLLISGEPQVPCYFIFGDSLVDNGNNNALLTQARVNYPPYGIDFPAGVATGRFTNGLNIADILGKLLGFVDFIPAFATASIGVDVSKGVNYGSGGSGIRPETGRRNLGPVISLDAQLVNHGIIVTRITALQANKTFTKDYLGKCIYTVGMGNNDYINNYFIPNQYPTSRLYTPDQYADVLVEKYSKQLEDLYKYGARKIAIFGLGLSGCTPAEILIFGADPSGCVDKINAAVALFNDRLKPLVDNLNGNLTDAKFILINNTNIGLGDPRLGGITVINAPCCETSVNFGKGQCKPNLSPCPNRDEYFFFDGFHPTEIVNNVSASRSYVATSPLDSYPIDIRTLAQQ